MIKFFMKIGVTQILNGLCSLTEPGTNFTPWDIYNPYPLNYNDKYPSTESGLTYSDNDASQLPGRNGPLGVDSGYLLTEPYTDFTLQNFHGPYSLTHSDEQSPIEFLPTFCDSHNPQSPSESDLTLPDSDDSQPLSESDLTFSDRDDPLSLNYNEKHLVDTNTTDPLAAPNPVSALRDIDDPNTSSSIPKNIINLSHRKLSRHSLSLLQKGPSFIPTTRHTKSPTHLINDLYKFKSKYVEKYKYMVPKRADRILRSTLESIKLDLEHCLPLRLPPNLSREEQRDLHHLATDKEIVISPTDKADAVVIIRTVDYPNMAYNHLNDNKTYQLLD